MTNANGNNGGGWSSSDNPAHLLEQMKSMMDQMQDMQGMMARGAMQAQMQQMQQTMSGMMQQDNQYYQQGGYGCASQGQGQDQGQGHQPNQARDGYYSNQPNPNPNQPSGGQYHHPNQREHLTDYSQPK